MVAPGWARVGITMSDPSMRERAASELARSILEQLTDGDDDSAQIALPI
jgi:hypothetical protein